MKTYSTPEVKLVGTIQTTVLGGKVNSPPDGEDNAIVRLSDLDND